MCLSLCVNIYVESVCEHNFLNIIQAENVLPHFINCNRAPWQNTLLFHNWKYYQLLCIPENTAVILSNSLVCISSLGRKAKVSIVLWPHISVFSHSPLARLLECQNKVNPSVAWSKWSQKSVYIPLKCPITKLSQECI